MTLEETRGTHVNAINIKSGKCPAEDGKFKTVHEN